MERLTPPEPLNLDGTNLADSWRQWRQRFELFSLATELTSKDAKIQSATLLHVIGPAALELYNTFTWDNEDDKQKVETILAKFAAYCIPRTNVTWERHVFNTRNQRDDENIDQYVTDLRKKAQTCEFQNLRDGLIRDRIVCGIKCDKTRSRLLKEPDLTLQKAIDICRANEAALTQMKSFATNAHDTLADIHGVHKDKLLCDRCGNRHSRQQTCQAFGAECHKCGRKNHFAKVCRTKSRPLHGIHVDHTDMDMFIGALQKAHHTKEWQITLSLNGQKTKLKIDTGAQCNVIPKQKYLTVCKAPLLKSTAKLTAFGGHRLLTCGKAIIPCTYNGNQYMIEFEVIDQSVPCILGLPTTIEMNLIHRVDTFDTKETPDHLTTVYDHYKDVFKGLGCISDVLYHININPSCQPIIHPPRRVPIKLRPKIQKELSRMEHLGVIERVTTPTSWVNSMVTILKPNGTLRICIDPRDLNNAINRDHYPTHTIEDVLTRMQKATIFSVLDASSGFWQIKLDEESARLCTFNTPFGRYMFKRLPFGLCSSQDIFQRVMSEMFEGVEGVEVVVDDILVWGENEQQHDERLAKVLERARLRNLKLNKTKCQIKKKQITYLGHILTSQGLQPDPKKIQAVNNMPPPQDKESLQRFLGMLTYLSKFIPNLSQIASPLRALLEKDTAWEWHHEHQDSFNKLKQLATTAPVLKYFKPDRPIKLSVDASSKGLGAVLIQDEHPIAYASKSLSSTQQSYAQIEKEMLAVVFGCTKFHDYIYGVPNVTVESDHKPLEAILKKPLCRAPLRLQRMIMTIQKYSINVVYRPGKQLVLADTLSRAFLEDNSVLEESFDVNALSIVPMSNKKLAQLKEATHTDPQLQQLSSVIKTGWPSHKQDVPKECLPFWNYRDELSVSDHVIFKGETIVIPKKMQPEMLQCIHSSHLGIEKCKRRARDVLFWPGMISQIQDTVSNCQICCTYQRNNAREPLLPHEVPDRPWAQVGADLFIFNNQYYLILVDYYSGFVELNLLNTTTSNEVIVHCKSQFARHGIPDKLITDNGPQFSSDNFKQFVSNYSFEHHTSSPHYPRSNGMAERAVQTVKNLLKKAILDKRDPYLALLEYRNTPTSDTLGSPAQRLMGRRTKTLLPTSDKLLQPKTIHQKTVQNELTKRRDRQKYYYDRHAMPLKAFSKGDQVMMKGRDRWQPATVLNKVSAPRSYVIKTPQGQIYRRNRQHLRAARSNNDTKIENDTNDDWLDDDIVSNNHDIERDTNQQENSTQNLQTLPTADLRRSQRTIRAPTRYTDSRY